MSVTTMLRADWRGWFFKLRSETARALVPRRTVRTRGLRFTLPCDNWVTRYRWQTYNTKEPETLDWIDRAVRAGDTFFDVGANIGVYALYAALRHPQARVVAIEPEYANLHLLRDNLVANGLQERVWVYALALSNGIGVSYLHLQDWSPGAALHTEFPRLLTMTQAGRPVLGREGISTMTLDAFCEQTGWAPHCMKIDVDGGELQILEGGRCTLRAPAFRSLLIELSGEPPLRQPCVRQLEEAGLRCQWRDATGRTSNEVWAREGAA